MYDNSEWPFIAENADGFNMPYTSFSIFSEAQVVTIFEQFTNKNLINHGVYSSSVPIEITSNMSKLPSIANVTAFMLYCEAPAMTTDEWTEALQQDDVDWPLITHCRAYSPTASTSDSVREQILMSEGIMMEFQVTDETKFDDALELLKFCVDNNKIVSFLTTFQETPDIFINAYKNFYYYLKQNLDVKYLKNENVIFIPNTYSDDQVLPETSGYGSTFGVAHWLIDQKELIDDGFIQPNITFSNLSNGDFFQNHHDLTVSVSTDQANSITSISLYINGELIGEDFESPYEWSGGELNDLETGYREVKVTAKTEDGNETSASINIRILGDANTVPGFFLAGDMYDCDLRNLPIETTGLIRHCYGKEWVDYKIDVQHAGLYTVIPSIYVQRSKQYGGTIILKSGSTNLGSFTTVLNDPDQSALAGFTEYPEAIIKDVQLEAGEQILRAYFEHPDGIINTQFYLYNFKFIIQDGPEISMTTPAVNSSGEYDDYDGPADIEIEANVTSTKGSDKIKQVELFVNNVSAGVLTSEPYLWNADGENDVLNYLNGGTYTMKIVATDVDDYVAFEEYTLTVVDRVPYTESHILPGTIKAWQYDLGGEGIGYHDFNTGYERGLGGDSNPRYSVAGDNEDVEVEIAAGEYCVSAIRRDEWLSYTISSIEAGTYNVSLFASANTGKSADVNVWLNNKLLTTVKTTETGSNFLTFDTFTSEGVVIEESLKTANIRLEFINSSISTYLLWLQSFSFTKVE